MNRRQSLAFVAAGGLFLGGHTPYGQWIAYRQKHLLIGAHRQDLPGYAQAKAIADHLTFHLPKARARVARAPAPSRLASLMATDQLDVALLDAATIEAMRNADGVFETYGRLDLQVLANFEPWTLVTMSDMPAEHAWLISAALEDLVLGDDPSDLPVHPGTLAFRDGEPEPK